jgi:hypothetical protein
MRFRVFLFFGRMQRVYGRIAVIFSRRLYYFTGRINISIVVLGNFSKSETFSLYFRID